MFQVRFVAAGCHLPDERGCQPHGVECAPRLARAGRRQQDLQPQPFSPPDCSRLDNWQVSCVLAVLKSIGDFQFCFNHSGLLIVKVFYHCNHPWMRSRSRLKLCLFALFLLAGGYGIYSYLVNNGFNPDWSIAKAKKWCKYKKWVKVRILNDSVGQKLFYHHHSNL